ncbi:class I adenylate-forming enzyme family protein [Methylotuvimicrobium sp.]|uniref:class I adenylate-forming enzyme family protein n=1 Tax=Methylotuvimicrobium sp. TaxID=2822413 RepID=UPI003D650945
MHLPSKTLIESLFKLGLEYPNHLAIISEGRKVLYGEFVQRIAATQMRLLDSDIKKGDRILIMGSNHDSFAVAYFAVHSIGAVAVPVSSSLKKEELAFIINDSKPKLGLTENTQNLKINQQELETLTRTDSSKIMFKIFSNLKDNADILYTTGTTSKKGVLLTHLNIAAAALNISTFIQNQQSDLEILPIPLSHSFGLGRLRSMAVVGNSLVLEPGLRNPALLLKRILDLKADGLALVPAGFELILGLTRDKLADARDHLKYIEIGSAALRDETRRKLMALLPKTRICHHYGLTEASRACFRELHADALKPISIGRPSPNVQINIIDDHGIPLNVDQVGEIVINGAMTMKSYWNRPDLDSKSFCDYGLRTGDIGRIDKDGYIYLHGRQNDIINVGGLKVSPNEVEDVVIANTVITDGACIGISDSITGQKVKLFYVADDVLDDRYFINQLRDKLEEYKIPKLFQRISSIPKTESGKILREKLKEM